jgi:hypothetical protein
MLGAVAVALILPPMIRNIVAVRTTPLLSGPNVACFGRAVPVGIKPIGAQISGSCQCVAYRPIMPRPVPLRAAQSLSSSAAALP